MLILDTGLEADCPFEDAKKLGIPFTPENVRMFSNHAFDDYLVKLYEYLQVLENRLFSSGLHTLGEAPNVGCFLLGCILWGKHRMRSVFFWVAYFGGSTE